VSLGGKTPVPLRPSPESLSGKTPVPLEAT
jgi:hypothetical protein